MLEKSCIGLVRILLGLILLFLTLISAFVTCRVYGGAEIVQYEIEMPVWHIVFFIWVIALIRMSKIKDKIKFSMKTETVCIILAVVIYILWIFLVPSWSAADSHFCMTSAKGLLCGDYSSWERVPFSYGAYENATGYAYTYPSQNGLILYMAVLSFVFGDAAFVFFQILNIFFFVLGIMCLRKLLCEKKEGVGLLIWMLFCLPFSFYILFVYGTVPGFGLSCLAMYRLVRYVRKTQRNDLLIGIFAASAAVLLKSNYLIVMIALFLYLAGKSIFKKKIRYMAAALLLICVYVAASRGMKMGISAVTGYDISGGAPMIAWVEMGLQEGSRGPGWYNGYQISLFEQADGDSEQVSVWVQEDLANTISNMIANPRDSAVFFLKKIASIWAEPTFQSLWIQEVGNSSWTETSIPWQLFKEEGLLNKIYVFVTNLMQTFVYAMACIWIIRGMSDRNLYFQKEDRWDMLLPGIIFIGGFIFHIFWEAKGQYTVVYFMLLLPYAYRGLIYTEKRCLPGVFR